MTHTENNKLGNPVTFRLSNENFKILTQKTRKSGLDNRSFLTYLILTDDTQNDEQVKRLEATIEKLYKEKNELQIELYKAERKLNKQLTANSH
jgi:hypothetical protein